MSLSELLTGARPPIRGTTAVSLDDYVTEILTGRFPALRGLSERALRLQLLFESLVAQSLRVYAQTAEATIGHLRTQGGQHEVDFVITGRGGKCVAVDAYRRADGVGVVPAALLGA